MNNKKAVVQKVKHVAGTIAIPGDKSVSHRSIMLASLADTPVIVRNFLHAQDCLSTVACMQALGADIVLDKATGYFQVTGNGLHGLKEPGNVLDAGNSGTTLRLLTGILAAQPFFSVMTGDASLRKRPMGRVITPLTQMGGTILGRENSRYAPLAILPGKNIKGIEYQLPVASAQIKSAIMLAALFAATPTRITEPHQSRNHSECMLASFGVEVTAENNVITVTPPQRLQAPANIDVPGDISSAAFWLVAASIIPGSEMTLTGVGINPTRTGILAALWQMGANITVQNERWSSKEPVADLVVKTAELKGITIEDEIIPRLIDEIPVLAVAALFAKGRTVVRGAGELRVKETDRLAAITAELSKMGAKIEETADGLIIDGPQQLNFACCQSYDDHRMAMALAVAGAAAKGAEIEEPNCVAISYPDFFAVLAKVSG